MKRSQQTCVMGGLLIWGLSLGLPRVSYAVTACTNTTLTGTYTAEAASTNLLNVLNSINSVSPAGVTGFLNNPNSLNGANPGTGRYYFDGNGNIVGQNTVTPTSGIPSAPGSLVGSYTVNLDCTASIALGSGATYYAVVVGNGARVLFLQTNVSPAGAVGSLTRSVNLCADTEPQSFGFSFSGAQQAGTSFGPYSALGVLQLNGSGLFTLQEWIYQHGAVSPVTASGTYTLNSNCTVQVSFNPSIGTPTTFTGFLINGATGLIVTQPDAFDTITGTLLGQ